MEKSSSTNLIRTKSEQLLETIAATLASSKSPVSSSDQAVIAGGLENTFSTLSRKSSKKMAMTSPGRNSTSGKNNHIRKKSSAQLKFDVDDVGSGGALSRASRASLGLSLSFPGYTMPLDENADPKPFSDDDNDIPEDLEAGICKKKKIQAEPTLPIYLKFTDVKYNVVIKGVTSTIEKEILSAVTGSTNPGEVLAMMGPSGSGKTTLLSLLGGRLKQPTGGLITYNGQPYSKFLKSRIGFVTQDDVLFPHLTVKETLTYAARLRLPHTLIQREKKQRAADVICELGLERCQDTMIGNSFLRGVSGGERKRVCIGNEIIINPSLILLDEPTSGLDSTTALMIVELLQEMAEAGKTVITTIHQPSSRLFHKFDKLILLGKGNLLYFGKASEALVYFTSIGCSPLIAMNPAEFLLDLANGNLNEVRVPYELEDKIHMENSEVETRKGRPSPATVLEYLVEAYETRAENEKNILLAPTFIDEELKAKICTMKREWGASWCEQYSILFWRSLRERRHDYFSWLRITQVLATAIILGMLWWQTGRKGTKSLQDQAGLLFFISVFWGFFPVFTAIFTFPQERAMLRKERAADMYRMSAYFLARTGSDIPLDLILPVLFLLVVYFMADLRPDAASFFLTVLTVFLCIIAAQGYGLAIGAAMMDLKRATTLASVTVMTFMLSGGYFVQNVPEFISWLQYLSFNYHTYKLLLKVQYEHYIHTVNEIEIDNGMKEVRVLAAMIVGYRLLAYISLRRMKL